MPVYAAWVLSLLFTAGTYLWIAPTLSLWWAFPILLGCFSFCQVLFAVYLATSTLFISKKPPEHPRRYARLAIMTALMWTHAFFRIYVKTEGKEKMPKEPTVIVCNHRAALDPTYIYTAFPRRRMAFMSKASVYHYPVVGCHMQRAGFLFIERDKPLQAARVIKRAARFVKEDGIDYGIFPEGTRSRDGSLLPFKSGAFVVAKKADAPIAVFTLQGSEKAWRLFSLRPARVYLRLEEVIPAETVREKTAEELSDMSRAIMEKALREHPLPTPRKKD